MSEVEVPTVGAIQDSHLNCAPVPQDIKEVLEKGTPVSNSFYQKNVISKAQKDLMARPSGNL